jgi:hypothetical protein
LAFFQKKRKTKDKITISYLSSRKIQPTIGKQWMIPTNLFENQNFPSNPSRNLLHTIQKVNDFTPIFHNFTDKNKRD